MKEKFKNEQIQRFMLILHKFRLMNQRAHQDKSCSQGDFGALLAVKIASRMDSSGEQRHPSTSEVAKTMGASMPAMSKTLRRLAMKGLVKQVPSEDDRRVMKLMLTPKGEAIVEEYNKDRHEIIQKSMERFGKDKLQQLHELLDELTTIMEEEIDKRNV